MIFVTTIGVQNAFAHGSTLIDGPSVNGITKKVSLVLGHSNEPTYGIKEGVHDGKHAVDVFLRDKETHLDLSGSSISVDKFYFDSIESFEGAKSVSEAIETKLDVPLDEVHGDPGHYTSRQINSPGIYGYRVFGTINYFGVADIPVDVTLFCRSSDSSTSKFNVGEWSGGFGCTENIDDITYPQR